MNLKVFVCHYFFFVSEQLFCLIYLNQLQRLKFNIYFALSESLSPVCIVSKQIKCFLNKTIF